MISGLLFLLWHFVSVEGTAVVWLIFPLNETTLSLRATHSASAPQLAGVLTAYESGKMGLRKLRQKKQTLANSSYKNNVLPKYLINT